MEPPDIELLRQAKAGLGGAQEAFSQLIDRHAPALLRLARSLMPTHHDAEDLLQETFIGAFRGLGSFQERSSVKTWLFSIMFRQAMVLRRKLAHPFRMLPQEIAESGPEPHAASDARLDIHLALDHLPEDARTILLLRELDGLSYEEIASVLQVPRGTVESRLFRAREALKGWLLPRGEPATR